MIKLLTALKSTDGYKTYGVVGVAVVLGVLAYFGIHIPDWVLYVVFGSGLATQRHAVSTTSNAVTAALNDIAAMISQSALNQVTTTPNPIPVDAKAAVGGWKQLTPEQQTQLLNLAQAQAHKEANKQ